MGKELLRKLPGVGTVLERPEWVKLTQQFQRELVRSCLEAELDRWREQILAGGTQLPELEALFSAVRKTLIELTSSSPSPILNGTGVVIHTNLGRAPLAAKALAAAQQAGGYCDLEFDLASGGRGSRHRHVEQMLCQLAGAEAAMIVNNNAAAVLLALAAVARGGEVVISRGQLVEIGGSFRIPEVMEHSGVSLREVGTTNKTYIDDYRQALGPETKALVRVHPSNFRVVGFSHEVSLAEMVELGREHQLPVIDDLGSGTLLDLSPWGIEEPTVQESVNAGADLISFSGDKLLGGPQCGLIVGSAHWIGRLKKHPLARALRCDKVTIASLAATLALYLVPEGWRQVPVLAMITEPLDSVDYRAQALAEKLSGLNLSITVDNDLSPVGGGALPLHRLKTRVVRLKSEHSPAVELALALRRQRLVGRIVEEQVVLDLRTLATEELDLVAAAVTRALEESVHE